LPNPSSPPLADSEDNTSVVETNIAKKGIEDYFFLMYHLAVKLVSCHLTGRVHFSQSRKAIRKEQQS
tara:strand:- start:739 stop:939 length:201 start_codon:yes stop_codon:yes gene_type:complete